MLFSDPPVIGLLESHLTQPSLDGFKGHRLAGVGEVVLKQVQIERLAGRGSGAYRASGVQPLGLIMNEAAMSAALDKIHQLAGLVLQEDLPRSVSEKIELIQFIARFKSDVSNPAELPPEERPTDDWTR